MGTTENKGTEVCFPQLQLQASGQLGKNPTQNEITKIPPNTVYTAIMKERDTSHVFGDLVALFIYFLNLSIIGMQHCIHFRLLFMF